MKILLAFSFFCIVYLSQAQTTGPCDGWITQLQDTSNRAAFGHLIMSSMSSTQNTPNKAVDGSMVTKAKTTLEENPYIQVDLGEVFHIPYIKAYSEDNISQFYVFASEYPIDPNKTLNNLLNDPNVWSNQTFNYTTGNILYVNEEARYIRLQFGDTRVLNISELNIPGGELGPEICGNGLDDNCDERIDCDDNKCGVNILNVVVTNASCPICLDGEISIQAIGNNKLFSIDGGITFSDDCWDSFESMCFYSGLAPGEYNIIVKNSVSNCTTSYPPLEVRSPPPGEDGDCLNGGFEHGNFEFWTGAYGEHDEPGPPVLQPGIQLFRHTIIPTASFVDKYVPVINGNYPGLGDYTCQLGNDMPGDEYGEGAEELQYCFIVDSENQDFNFVYAMVMQDHGHSDQVNPYFEWQLSRINPNNPNQIILIDGEHEIADLNDDYFTDLDFKEIVYKPWTCRSVDLSPYLGQEVCIRFRVVDCTDGGHFGYAYIDGLCSNAEDLAPIVEILSNDVYCDDQVKPVIVSGVGYNRYEWNISKIDNNGVQSQTASSGIIIDPNASIDDIISYYEEISNYEIECDDQLYLELTVYNDCASTTASKRIKLDCNHYTIDYCNIIVDCLGDETERIIGVNNCDDCEITWWPQQYLILDDPKFPLVTAAFFANAFDQTYNVRVVSPEGCIWRESIVFQDEMPFTISFQENISYCDYALDIILTFEDEFHEALIDVKAFDILSTVPFDQYYPQYVPNESSGVKKVYRLSVPREEATKIKAYVRVFPEGQACNTEDVCTKTAEHTTVPKSAFVEPWYVQLPEVFSPDGDGVDDLWWPLFVGTDNECNNIPQNVINNHIYHVDLLITDRWNNVKFEKEIYLDPLSPIGMDYKKFTWDGKAPNGVLCPPASYTCRMEIDGCHSGETCPPYGHDCIWPSYFCTTESHDVVWFTITIPIPD